MNKICIIYHSPHLKNTEKILFEIARKHPQAELVEAAKFTPDILEQYDTVGLASGIYYGKLSARLLKIMDIVMKSRVKRVFFIYTSGVGVVKNYENKLEEYSKENGKNCLGFYGCKALDKFGPFRLIGGLNKGRPNEEDIEKAISFFEEKIL